MKKLLAAALVATMLALPVSAEPDAPAAPATVGEATYTNIIATIDGLPIRSYNIAGNTYITVEDLVGYGFAIVWDGAAGRLVISPERTALPEAYTTTYVPEIIPAALLGQKRAELLETNITVWVGERQITGYNIGGQMLVWLDELATALGATVVWSPEESALRMLSPGVTPVVRPIERPVTEGCWALTAGVATAVQLIGQSTRPDTGAFAEVTADIAMTATAHGLRIYGGDGVAALHPVGAVYDVVLTDLTGTTLAELSGYSDGTTVVLVRDGLPSVALAECLAGQEAVLIVLIPRADGGATTRYSLTVLRENFAFIYASVS